MSDIFSVLADPTRRALLLALAAKSQSVGDLVTLTGEGQPTVSKHLKTLREAGLVTAAAAGQARVYSIDRGPLAEVSAFLNEIAPGQTGAGSASSKTASAANDVEKTLTDAATVLAGWINDGAAWIGTKAREVVAENELTPERLGKDLGRKLADAKLQATDTAGDVEAQLRAEIGDISSRLGVRAADLRGSLDALLTEVKEKASDKVSQAKDNVFGAKPAEEEPEAEF
jgi:ArsR family transcriptional regulator